MPTLLKNKNKKNKKSYFYLLTKSWNYGILFAAVRKSPFTMKNLRVKDLGITERRKGFKNDSPKGVPRVSAAYRLPTETKLKLVAIADALGSSETAAFVEIVNNYYENQEEIRRAVQFEKLKKEREALKERLAKINNEIGSLGS